MRFVIAGAGEVGYHIIESIHREGVNITVVDGNEAVLERLHRLFWVKTVLGNASNRDTLEKAEVGNADLFMAVTDFDEINIISSLIAKQMGAKQGVARLSAFNELSAGDRHAFGIDLVINPSQAAAEHLEQLALHPSTIDFVPFLNGKVALIGVKVRHDTTLEGMRVMDFGQNTKLPDTLIALVERNGAPFIPHADTVMETGDSVYFLCVLRQWKKFASLLGLPTKPSQKVFINGGGMIGESLALRLERRGVDVRVIEKDARRCETLSQILESTLVLNADGTDDLALKSEGIGGADCFFSACERDEVNLLSCLMAKEAGARSTVALIRQPETISILHEQDLVDAAINPRLLTARKILKYVQGTDLRSFFSFPNSNIEVVELEIHETADCVGKTLRSLKLPSGALLVGAIRRKGKIHIPRGEEKLRIGDIILLVQKRNCREISRLFFWPIASARKGTLISKERALQERAAFREQAESLAEEMLGSSAQPTRPSALTDSAFSTQHHTPSVDSKPLTLESMEEMFGSNQTDKATQAPSISQQNAQNVHNNPVMDAADFGAVKEMFGHDTPESIAQDDAARRDAQSGQANQLEVVVDGAGLKAVKEMFGFDTPVAPSAPNDTAFTTSTETEPDTQSTTDLERTRLDKEKLKSVKEMFGNLAPPDKVNNTSTASNSNPDRGDSSSIGTHASVVEATSARPAAAMPSLPISAASPAVGGGGIARHAAADAAQTPPQTSQQPSESALRNKAEEQKKQAEEGKVSAEAVRDDGAANKHRPDAGVPNASTAAYRATNPTQAQTTEKETTQTVMVAARNVATKQPAAPITSNLLTPGSAKAQALAAASKPPQILPFEERFIEGRSNPAALPATDPHATIRQATDGEEYSIFENAFADQNTAQRPTPNPDPPTPDPNPAAAKQGN